MNDSRMREIIRSAMDTCLSGVQPDALVTQRAVNRANAASKGTRARRLIPAASLALALAAAVIVAASLFPAWLDARSATQAADAASPSPALFAAAQQSPVAPDQYGWEEYLAENGHPPILDAFREILDNTQEQAFNMEIPNDPQRRSLVFTLREQYADPYIAIAAIHVSLPEGASGILCHGDASEDYPIDPAAADSLGVSRELSWREAAEQLNCPLYRVWADLDATQEIPRLNLSISSRSAVRYHEDGSITLFTIAYLYGMPDKETESVPLSLYLTVNPINMGIPAYDDAVHYVWAERIAFSIEPVSATRSYAYTGDPSMPMSARIVQWDAAAEDYSFEDRDLTLRLTGVRADQTPAGIYVTAGFRAEETIYGGHRILDSSRIRVTPAAWNEEYDPLPAGLEISLPADGSKFPSVTFTRMINTADFPESMIFELQEPGPDDSTTILSIPLQLSAGAGASQAPNRPVIPRGN